MLDSVPINRFSRWSTLGLGAYSVLMSAVWVEIYGAHNIGTIRGITSSVGILSTALAPMILRRKVN